MTILVFPLALIYMQSIRQPSESQDNHETPAQTKKKLCQTVKARMQKEYDCKVEEHCSTLTVQGRWTELLEAERSDTSWRSSLSNAPRGVFEFALNGMANWLPTRDNLVRWGKLLSTKCPLCKGHQSLRHVLNACPVALTDRYTWRHNSVLKELAFYTGDVSSDNKM